MKKVITFEEVLEAADRLSLEEQGAIIDILRRRLIDQRHQEIVQEVHEARKEYQEGRCRQASTQEIINDILS
jgi:hypothetical protein